MKEANQPGSTIRSAGRWVSTVRISIVLFLLLVGVSAFFVAFTAPPDPIHRGRPISQYLGDMTYPWFPRTPAMTPPQMVAAFQNYALVRKEAEAAIQALGPQAIPLLQSWLRTYSPIRARLRAAAAAPGSRLQWLLRWRFVRMDRSNIAFDALKRLIPQHAGPLLPMLRKEILSGNERSAAWATSLLGSILEAVPLDERRKLAMESVELISVFTNIRTNLLQNVAVDALAVLVRHNDIPDKEGLVKRLWDFHQSGFNVMPAILELDPDGLIRNTLALESGTALEIPPAVVYFIDSPQSSERIVPLLTSHLASTNNILVRYSCEALGSYGTNAVTALPILTNLLKHPQLRVAGAASNAIVQIAGR